MRAEVSARGHGLHFDLIATLTRIDELMRLIYSLIALATVFVSASSVSAHGIPLEVAVDATGRLYSPTRVTYVEHDSALEPFPESEPTLLRGTIGFYPVLGKTIPTGAALTVDAAGTSLHPAALAYWDGASVLPSPQSVTLSRTGVNFDVGPTDDFVAGGQLGAYNGELGGHSSLTLALPLDAPTGLYAIGFQVTSPGFERSETFWAVANHGLAPEDAAAGVSALAAAVPEPASVVTAIVTLGALAMIRRRR